MVGTDPDFDKTFQQIVNENGFIYESHPVTTDDGYILNVFRIRSSETKPDAKVVFLMHGITDSADCFIVNYPNVAPAFQLVRAGYDVWLGNQRGTKYSLGHTKLDWRTDEAYWLFSWTEMGDHDAPAQINFVRTQTGADKVSYIAHSQGTTQMFYNLAKEDSSYWGERLNLFVALAPVTWIDHTTSKLFADISVMGNIARDALYAAGVYHLLDGWQSLTMQIACRLIPELCQFGEGFLITQNPKLDDPVRYNVYMGHFPAGASVQSLIHYGQMIFTKKFQLYDWGRTTNLDKYGQKDPPEVHLNNYKGEVPIAMFVGTADDLGDQVDATKARDTINTSGHPVQHFELVEAGHASFLIGKNMTYFDNVMKLVSEYNV